MMPDYDSIIYQELRKNSGSLSESAFEKFISFHEHEVLIIFLHLDFQNGVLFTSQNIIYLKCQTGYLNVPFSLSSLCHKKNTNC